MSRNTVCPIGNFETLNYVATPPTSCVDTPEAGAMYRARVKEYDNIILR